MTSTPGPAARRPIVAAWLAAAAVYAVLLLVFNEAVVLVLAPALLRAASMEHLRDTAGQLSEIVYAATFLAAAGGGLVAGRQAQRWGLGSIARLASAILGAVLVLVLMVGYAWLQKFPTPIGPILAHGALTVIGAGVGSAVWRSPRGPHAVAPAAPATRALAGLLMLTSVPVFGFGVTEPPPTQRPVAAVDLGGLDVQQSACTVVSIAEAFKGSVTVASIDFGPSFVYQESRTADGMWHAQVSTGIQAGLKVTVGEHVGAKVLGGVGLKEGLSIEASSHATVLQVGVYNLTGKDASDKLVKWGLEHYLTDLVVVPSLSELIKPQLSPFAVYSDFKQVAPIETDLELGGDVQLSLSAGVLVNYTLDLSAGAAAGVKLMDDNNKNPGLVNDPKSLEFYVRVDGAADAAAVVGLATFGAGGSGDVVLAVTVAKNDAGLWLPSEIGLEGTAGFTVNAAADLASLGAHAGAGGVSPTSPSKVPATLGKFANAIKGLGSSGAGGINFSSESKLDFAKYPADQALFFAFLVTLEPELKGKPTADDNARFELASQALAGAFDRDGDLTVTANAVASGDASFDVQFGETLAFGAKAEVDLTRETLAAAKYRNGSRVLTPSTGCVAPGYQ